MVHESVVPDTPCLACRIGHHAYGKRLPVEHHSEKEAKQTVLECGMLSDFYELQHGFVLQLDVENVQLNAIPHFPRLSCSDWAARCSGNHVLWAERLQGFASIQFDQDATICWCRIFSSRVDVQLNELR